MRACGHTDARRIRCTEQLLHTLDEVRIGELSGDDFVLLGLENLSHRKVTAV